MERVSRNRAIALLLFFAMIIGLYSVRLFKLQIVDAHDTDNTTKYTTITRVKAARGDILDRNGNILIGNRASYDLVFNHYVITSSSGTNESLLKLLNKCKELGVDHIDHFPVTKTRPYEYIHDQFTGAWRNYFNKYLLDRSVDSDITAPLLVQRMRERYHIPEEWSDDDARAVIGLRYEFDLRGAVPLSNYTLMEDVSDENLSALLELNIPGLMVESSTVREYYTSYGAHILGTMGAMDAKQWEKYKDKENYAMDAIIGQSGFEAAFEEYLHGTDGTRVDVVARDGTIIKQYYKEGCEPKAGNNVETTIDLHLQIIAEETLADIIYYLQNPEDDPDLNVAKDGRDVEGAAVVVMKIDTGEVLACASYPTYDPKTYNQDYEEILKRDFDPLFNRAFHAGYPIGSTYKMCTLTAAMLAGKYKVGEIIETKGIYTEYEGFYPKCHIYPRNHGNIEATEALEVSCNYFFYTLADRLTNDELDNTAKGFGFGEPTGIELDEFVGYRANAESKKKVHEGLDDSNWYIGDRIQAGIGQSENKITPLQLCSYACTLANKGTRYKATFLNRIVSSDYRTLVRENEPAIASKMEIPDYIYREYLEGMIKVVSGARGTARTTMKGLDFSVAAKTGTAQTGMLGSDNGSFICWAPADNPEIAIAVYGEKAAHGATLGRVAKAILEYYFSADKTGDVPVYENKLA